VIGFGSGRRPIVPRTWCRTPQHILDTSAPEVLP